MSEHSFPSDPSDLLRNLWSRSLIHPGKNQSCQKTPEQRNGLLQIGCLLAKGNSAVSQTGEQLEIVSQALGLLSLRNDLHREAFEVIRQTDFAETLKLEIFEAILEAAWKIRRGQAFDRALRMDEIPMHAVRDLCLHSMELKSGAMAVLCLRLGSLFGTKSVPPMALERWGKKFGVVSQMIEDIVFLKPPIRKMDRMEDLILRKPNWIWAGLAEHGTAEMQSSFRQALRRLPDTRELDQFLAESLWVEKVFSRAICEWNQVLLEMKKDFRLRADHPALRVAEGLGALITAPLLQN